MANLTELSSVLDRFPRIRMGHTPTPVERLHNLSSDMGINLSVKRDDCTGVAFGGNKVRQLEFYLGEAQANRAETVLITGAVQSNFVRTTAAMAAKLGMGCHVQLEERVKSESTLYQSGGNVLLDKLLGARLHRYPAGEDENGADEALDTIAAKLSQEGVRPYVVHLGMQHPPTGALGYVAAALELAGQLDQLEPVDVIYIASGSALTHCGLLYGLRILGIDIPVRGVCVRRPEHAQRERVTIRLSELGQMLVGAVPESAIDLTDTTLAPGYGVMSSHTRSVIETTAKREGLLLDPVYSGKAMSAIFNDAKMLRGKHVLMWHTGGQPALFAYQDAFCY